MTELSPTAIRLTALHRPAISYAVTYTAHVVGWGMLRRHGFRCAAATASCPVARV